MSENVATDLGLELKVGRHWALPSQMQGEAAGKHWGACRPALMMAREQLRVGRYRKCFRVLEEVARGVRPKGNEPGHALLMTMAQPKWWRSDAHKTRPFTEVLLDWEQLIVKYDAQVDVSEHVTRGLKCATLLGWAPKHVEDMLRSAAASIRQSRGRQQQQPPQQHHHR